MTRQRLRHYVRVDLASTENVDGGAFQKLNGPLNQRYGDSIRGVAPVPGVSVNASVLTGKGIGR